MLPGHLVILLDEPTSVLERAEIDILFNRVRALKYAPPSGFVSHRLDVEGLKLSDRAFLRHEGRRGGRGTCGCRRGRRDAASTDGRKGTQQADYYYEPLQMPVQDAILLEADQLACGAAYRNVGFKLRAGEVLGIAGVIGSGREELTRTLAGFCSPYRRNSQNRQPRGAARNPAEAVDLEELATISSQAAGRGARSLPVCFSQYHSGRSRESHPLRLDRCPEEGARCRHGLDRSAQSPARREHQHTLCLGLSGGKQQKVVLAKWLNAKARILVLDHPTRGLDVGAKEEVYDLVRRLTGAGLSIVLTSDTLEETIELNHSVLVMRDGEITHRADAARGAKPQQIDLIGHMV